MMVAMIRIALLLLMGVGNWAQKPQLRFSKVTSAQGLSQSSVHCMTQDLDGFIWMGTTHGLNRYDGKEMVIYRHDRNDPTSILSNRITDVIADSENGLWVGTYGGLSYSTGQEPLTRKFLPTPLDGSHPIITSVFQDSHDQIWVGTTIGLFVRKGSKFELIHHEWSADNQVTDLLEFEGQIWVCNRQGLFNFNQGLETFEPVTVGDSDYVFALLVNENKIWAASNNGLYVKETHQMEFEQIYEFDQSPRVYVSSMAATSDAIWIGTPSGLGRMDKSTLQVDLYQYDVRDAQCLSANYVWDLMVDRQQTLWIATSPGGANRLVQDKPYFQVVTELPTKDTLIHDNLVIALSQANKVTWVGTQFDGLRRINGNKSTKIWPAEGLASVLAICESRFSPTVWFSTMVGLYEISDPNQAQPKAKRLEALLPEQRSILDLCEDEDGVVWLGATKGLSWYDPGDGSHVDLSKLVPESISAIKFDSSGSLWLACKGRVARITDPKSPAVTVETIHQSPYDWFHDLAEDKHGVIWIGGDLGLMKWDPIEETLTDMNKELGVEAASVSSILIDQHNSLWISSRVGLILFDQERKSSRVFSQVDGLNGLEFTPGASFALGTSLFMLGGVNGYCFFDPNQIKRNGRPVDAAITDVTLFYEAIDEHLWQVKESGDKQISLTHQQNNLSFSFAALDFEYAGRNRFSYMLNGYESSWQQVGSHNFAHYSKLAPGEYVFKVKAANSDGIWSDAPASIAIVIAPPFWRTAWFVVLISLALASLCAWIFAARTRMKKRLELAAIESRRLAAADFHDHLGHQLTRMAMLSTLAKDQRSDPAKLNVRLEQIQSTSQRLYLESRDFIWSLLPGEHKLADLALYLKDFGDELFDSSTIHFRFESRTNEMANISLSGNQRRHLSLIVKEALHNSLRHSLATDVTLHLSYKSSAIEITVEDNGCGFDLSASTGLGLRNIKERSKALEASFAIDSEPNVGSRIQITCPIKQNGGDK